jgi:hypothetical protein
MTKESMLRGAAPTMDFEDLIAKGENPLGFTAQTANGSCHWSGTGWNRVFDYDLLREQLPPKGPWAPGRSNRTGE